MGRRSRQRVKSHSPDWGVWAYLGTLIGATAGRARRTLRPFRSFFPTNYNSLLSLSSTMYRPARLVATSLPRCGRPSLSSARAHRPSATSDISYRNASQRAYGSSTSSNSDWTQSPKARVAGVSILPFYHSRDESPGHR